MVKFRKDLRYKNRAGQTFGKGVWVEDNGNWVKPGDGFSTNRGDRTITQLNTDGTKTFYPWEDWAKKKASEAELEVLMNDRAYVIPVLPEKMMTITIDKNSPTSRNRGATFSENLLDSIAVNAKRADLPFSTALGMASTESTMGQGKRGPGYTMLPWLRFLNSSNNPYKEKAQSISYEGYYSPALLVSNWNQRNETPFHNYLYDGQGQLLKQSKSSTFYDEDINSERKNSNRYNFEEISPLQHAFRTYRQNPRDYNPNDPDYPKKVEANARELVNYSPEIKDYMKKNNLKSEGGDIKETKTWDELSMAEKSEMIKTAVDNGITNLADIKTKYNEFAKGGNIHIKPENRGKFTALKKRTGHSATWFKEHGTPAQKKMATFALNSRHWKHGLGGNLFEDGGDTDYVADYDDTYGAKYGILPEVVVTPKGVPNIIKPKLNEKHWQKYWGDEGAASVSRGMNQVAPYLAPLVAAPAVGPTLQGITALGDAAFPIVTNPYVETAITSAFAGHGLNHAINEGVDGWGDAAITALELAPLGRLAKPIYKGVVQPGVRLFNSPLTGNWTKIGNREYRLSPNSLGANGPLLESKPIASQDNVTNNLLKWLGKSDDYMPQKPISQENNLYFEFHPEYKRMIDIWKSKDVNLDKIEAEDIEMALKKRWNELLLSRKDRHTIARPDGNVGYFLHDIIPDENTLYGWKNIGTTQLEKDAIGNMHMKDITNNTGSVRNGKPVTEHGVQEKALNAAIKVANSEGGEGVVTGEWWLSAPKQQHIVQKYHDRKVIGNTGQHSNANMVEERINADIRKGLPITGEEETLAKSMLDLRRAGDKEIKTLFNQPFWLLRTPTYNVPVKSTLFDPTIIDRFGKMHINWKDPNIFRGIAYPTLLSTGLYGTQK